MPNAPPSRHEHHSALGNLRREYTGVEKQDKAQSGILDTGLQGHRATVLHRNLTDCRRSVTYTETYQIMDKYYNEYKI